MGIAPKIEPKQESVEPVSTQAYEAFLSKKEEKPKSGQGKFLQNGKVQLWAYLTVPYSFRQRV